jgi:hypothetical protein
MCRIWSRGPQPYRNNSHDRDGNKAKPRCQLYPCLNRSAHLESFAFSPSSTSRRIASERLGRSSCLRRLASAATSVAACGGPCLREFRLQDGWLGRSSLVLLHCVCDRPIAARNPMLARRRSFQRKEQAGELCSQAKKLLVLNR